MSIFAIERDAVSLDTSKDGENWRVLFHRDKSFSLIARDETVEGTKIQIIKSTTRAEFDAFARSSREVVTYWCKHVEAEIRFEGDMVSCPVDLDAPLKVRAEDEGTLAVVGFPENPQPSFGFYNKGLTLLEGGDLFFSHISFKLSSRYLEHTLTRDNVIRDANFHKAMAMVDRLATESLPRLLFERLEEAVLEEETSKRLDFLYRAATGCLTSRKRDYKHRLDLDADGIEERVVFKTVSGREVTLKEIRGATRKGRRFLIETGESPLTRALQAAGELVLEVNSNGAAYQFLRALHREKELVYAPAKYCLPVPARSDEETRRWEPLRRALTRLIESYGGKLRGVELAHFRYKGSGIGGRVAITQERLGELTLRSDTGARNQFLLTKTRSRDQRRPPSGGPARDPG